LENQWLVSGIPQRVHYLSVPQLGSERRVVEASSRCQAVHASQPFDKQALTHPALKVGNDFDNFSSWIIVYPAVCFSSLNKVQPS
jgi:hypothetical protein